jgi:CheY-like chemotaxis protein
MLRDAACRACIVDRLATSQDEDDADTAELIRLALACASPAQALADLAMTVPGRRDRIERAAAWCRRRHARCLAPGSWAGHEVRTTTPAAQRRQPHVLILGDVSADLPRFTLALEPQGYLVTAFLVAAMAPLPDAIVHHLRVPQHHDAEQQILRQVRRHPVVGRIPLILCTATDLEDPMPVATTPGHPALRVIGMPVDLAALRQHLRQQLPRVGQRLVPPAPLVPTDAR